MSKEEIQEYVGKVVKVTYSYEFRNFADTYTVIASLKHIDEKFGYIYLGHPYDLDKKETTAGEIGLRYDYDKIQIEPISQEEYEIWQERYKEFHKIILEIKGYDSCQEDIDKLTK